MLQNQYIKILLGLGAALLLFLFGVNVGAHNAQFKMRLVNMSEEVERDHEYGPPFADGSGRPVMPGKPNYEAEGKEQYAEKCGDDAESCDKAWAGGKDQYSKGPQMHGGSEMWRGHQQYGRQTGRQTGRQMDGQYGHGSQRYRGDRDHHFGLMGLFLHLVIFSLLVALLLRVFLGPQWRTVAGGWVNNGTQKAAAMWDGKEAAAPEAAAVSNPVSDAAIEAADEEADA